ncbi:membrane protein [soil metagenome]
MRSVLGVVVLGFGVLVALFGTLFFFQGIGVVTGSPMTNTTTWTVLGPIIAVIGVGVAVLGWRLRKA